MHSEVKNYYGEVLQSSADLKTSACCTTEPLPAYLKAALGNLHAEVVARYYGCGLVVPEALEGTSVLDLGCGAGRDVYTLSRLVGSEGQVVGVDMTVEQLAVARKYRDWHADRFGYPASNVEFIEGTLEKLSECGLGDNRFDVIVSNCVINLVTDKQAVMEQAWQLLKPGGEIYFADIYADRRVPEALTTDPVLYGECLSGALYWKDFIQLARRAGFAEPRLVADKPVTVEDPELAAKVGDIRFFSKTYRLFKLNDLEADREDYGQTARYLGTVPHFPNELPFDSKQRFATGVMTPICGNTWKILQGSRFAPHFELSAATPLHAGPFDATALQTAPADMQPDGAAGCC